MNLVESTEEIVEISKVNVDEEFGNKAIFLKQPQGSWTTKIKKIKSRKMCIRAQAITIAITFFKTTIMED